MEVDSSEMNSDGGRGLDDVEEPSPPEDKMFFMDPGDLDGDKDEEAVKTIRFVKLRFWFEILYNASRSLSCAVKNEFFCLPLFSWFSWFKIRSFPYLSQNKKNHHMN